MTVGAQSGRGWGRSNRRQRVFGQADAEAGVCWSSRAAGELFSRARDWAKPLERGGERVRPGPVGSAAAAGSGGRDGPAARRCAAAGDAAVWVRRRRACRSRQTSPGSSKEVLGDQRELEPCLVVGEGVVREVAHAGVFAVANAVLDPGALPMAGLQDSDVTGLVGEEACVPVAVGSRRSETVRRGAVVRGGRSAWSFGPGSRLTGW